MDKTTFLDNLFSNPNIKISDLKKGLTNQNFLLTINDEHFVLRTPRCDSEMIIERSHETLALEAIKDADIDVENIYYDEKSGYKVTKYLTNAKTFEEYIGDDKIIRVAKLMKKFHSLHASIGVAFDPLQRYKKYRHKVQFPIYDLTNYEEILNDISTTQQHMILCHNDWVAGNMLFTKEKTYLIDYEYAADNDPISDVMSFLTENKIVDEEIRNVFYRTYFKEITPEILQRLSIWECFHNLLWCMWAMMMWENRKETIYRDIAKDKYEALAQSYQHWKIKKD